MVKIEVVACRIGYSNVFVVNVKEGKGGMALFWHNGLDISIIKHTNYFILVQLKDDYCDKYWNATSCSNFLIRSLSHYFGYND